MVAVIGDGEAFLPLGQVVLSRKVLHRIRGTTAHLVRRVLKDNKSQQGTWTCCGGRFFANVPLLVAAKAAWDLSSRT